MQILPDRSHHLVDCDIETVHGVQVVCHANGW